MELISRKRALQQMRARDTKGQAIPFSVVVCKLNYATGTGGGRLHVEQAVIYKQKHIKKPKQSSINRMPAHDENGTLNLKILPSGEIRSIHIRLIEKFNGKTIFD